MSEQLVECRIIACDRPFLLERAIQSLQRQTHKKWKAIVFDDSKTKSGLNIVIQAKDKRIKYHHNKIPLGACQNINQGFSPKPIFNGSFAFILEDDNALHSQFIEESLKKIKNFKVISMNQEVYKKTNTGNFKKKKILNSTKKDQEINIDDLKLRAFLGKVLPNGGYFWKIGALDLQVDFHIQNPGLQECLRQLKIKENILLLAKPYSFWTQLKRRDIKKNIVSNRSYGASFMLLAKKIWQDYGYQRNQIWKQKLLLNEKKKYEQVLASISIFFPKLWYFAILDPITSAKGLVKTVFIKSYLNEKEIRAINNIKL